MKYALTLILAWLSFSCYCQTSNEALIKDASGNVVGRVSTYTNYTGRTESTLYDRNGHVLGSVQGANCGSLLGTHFTGSYTIVGDGNTSNVVLGSGTQALDYYLAVSTTKNAMVSVPDKDAAKRNKILLDYYDSNPEYLGLKFGHIEIIEKVASGLIEANKPQDEINLKKYNLIEQYLLDEGAKKKWVKNHMKSVGLILGVKSKN